MKLTIVLTLLLNVVFLFCSCTSNQKDLAENKSKNDSTTTIDLSKAENKIGVFTPPDSNYTGDYFEKYASGVIKVRGGYRFGKKSGKWMYFFPDGKLWSEAYFHLDKMNGESNVYYPNGKLMYNGFYKMDVADSVWVFYDSLGVLAQKIDYNQKKPKQK